MISKQHLNSELCHKGEVRRKNRQDTAKARKTAEQTVFYVGGVAIKNVKEFKYLGRVVTNDDNDEAVVMNNLKCARQKWAQIGKVLVKHGARSNPKVMAAFYKTIVQSVLLYGSESWVLTRQLEGRLESFHRRCARFVVGEHIHQNKDGSWTYPSSKRVLRKAGLLSIKEYIK